MATATKDDDKGHGHDVSDEPRDEKGRFVAEADKPPAKKPAARKPAESKTTATKTPAKPRTPRAKANEPKSKGSDSSHSTAMLWGAAAAGVAVGVAAMIGRKVAVQAPTALAGDWDAALAAEHTAVIKIFDALEKTTAKDVGKRTIMLGQLKHALAKHALQEENVVYPELRDHGSKEGADQLNHEHGYVKQYLYELENCPKDSAQFLTILGRFRTDLEEHVREEEDELYPALKAKQSPDEIKKVTMAMNKEGFKLA